MILLTQEFYGKFTDYCINKNEELYNSAINLISQISIDLKKIVVENSNDKLIEKYLSKLKNNILLIFSKNMQKSLQMIENN